MGTGFLAQSMLFQNWHFKHGVRMLGRVIYFDHNATSPLCPAAREAWQDACERYPGNPSSPHRLGSRSDAALTEARQIVAEFLGCSPLDIIWTSGATEANNALVQHCAAEGELWISAIEHPSLLLPARKHLGPNLGLLRVTPDGTLDLEHFAQLLKQRKPALVALMAANNETGALQPWKGALEICREHSIPVACDASQWIGKLDSAELGQCDFLTGCAHKFGGPVGVGFMKVPSHFRPFILGGGQEDGRRAGTENLPAILAMVAAWKFRNQQLSLGDISMRQRWRDNFLNSLCQKIPGIEVVGKNCERLWNTAAVLMASLADCRRRWVVQLDKRGFAVSTGSACASGKEKPSHVLTAMRYDRESSDRMLRFSSSWETSENDWQTLAQAVLETSEEFPMKTI
jgi:cysteine desulfurase